jgi:prepilin-type N-terminal cleavage/methylation domain-containing protein/prepilin-type processing-associated H-X9-DG protein
MKKQGYTLIELLVTTSIVCILIALLMPALNVVKEKALEIKCFNNLKQIHLAAELYKQDYFGFLPSGRADEVEDPEEENPAVKKEYWYNKFLSYTGDIENQDALGGTEGSILDCPAAPPSGDVERYSGEIKIYFAGGGSGRWGGNPGGAWSTLKITQNLTNGCTYGTYTYESFYGRSGLACDTGDNRFKTITDMDLLNSNPLVIILTGYSYNDSEANAIRECLDKGGILLGLGDSGFQSYLINKVYNEYSGLKFETIMADDPIYQIMYDTSTVQSVFSAQGLYIDGYLKAISFPNRRLGCALMHPMGDGLPGERAFRFMANVTMYAYENYFTGKTSYGYNYNLGMKEVDGKIYKINKYPSPSDTLLAVDSDYPVISGPASIKLRHRYGANMLFLDGHIEKGYKGKIPISIFTIEED